MIDLKNEVTLGDLTDAVARVFPLAAERVRSIVASQELQGKTPVFTVGGKYVPQGWTEWTQGFQVGMALLCFDGLDDTELLDLGRRQTLELMPTHLTSFGVHDHGFNNVSTYGNLLRLLVEGRFDATPHERVLYETALKVSGSVQASRWTDTDEGGFIYSFNGPHSLFADTIRSLRSLAVAHRLGHQTADENDERICLLERLLQHASTTAEYNVYYGNDRDRYDICGRVAHESIFNVNDGQYRCPSTQQGYSAFTTWTRGLAWIMLGYAEQLEFLDSCSDEELDEYGSRQLYEDEMLAAGIATCDFYIQFTPVDGVPYWDTGAPGLSQLGDYLDRPADPFNEHEPVDSSAAAIAAQGLLRLGRYLESRDAERSRAYQNAGLRIAKTLTSAPYLSESDEHQGLLLHSIYHHPKAWDHVSDGQKIPNGESCMWGDYHLLELCVYLQRLQQDGPYYRFWAE